MTRTTWARFFDADEPVYAMVAARGGELLGLAHYLFHRSTTAIALTCYLQDLFTDEAARGNGVGRALIDGVYTGDTGRIRACTSTCTKPTSRGGSTTRSRTIPDLPSIANCSD